MSVERMTNAIDDLMGLRVTKKQMPVVGAVISAYVQLEPRLGELEARETPLRGALRRLLWNSVADQDEHDDSCAHGDPSPLCQAWSALGFGAHWPGYDEAEQVLADVEADLRTA